MDVAYDKLFPDVLVHAPNCPEPVVVNAIRSACIELCQTSLCLTRPLDPISVVANEAVIAIDSLPGYDVGQLVGPLYYNNRKLRPFSHYELNDKYSISWESMTAEEPSGYVMYTPDEVTLFPIPTRSADAAITGKVAYVPTSTSTRVDSAVLEGFRPGLISGALSKILMVPDQPYTNEQKALHYARLFEDAKANAATSVRTSFVQAPMRVAFQRF